MILLTLVLASIGVALLRGGSLRRLAETRIRIAWILFVAVVLQAYVAYAPVDRLEADRPVHSALLMGSYALIALFVWANRSLSGSLLVGVGLLLNVSVMLANGGFMPITAEAILAAGTRPAETLPLEGARLPAGKDILLPVERTQLWLLSDAIPIPPPIRKVFSIGDLVVDLGAFLLLQSVMLPRRNRRQGSVGGQQSIPLEVTCPPTGISRD